MGNALSQLQAESKAARGRERAAQDRERAARDREKAAKAEERAARDREKAAKAEERAAHARVATLEAEISVLKADKSALMADLWSSNDSQRQQVLFNQILEEALEEAAINDEASEARLAASQARLAASQAEIAEAKQNYLALENDKQIFEGVAVGGGTLAIFFENLAVVVSSSTSSCILRRPMRVLRECEKLVTCTFSDTNSRHLVGLVLMSMMSISDPASIKRRFVPQASLTALGNSHATSLLLSC